MHPLSRWLEALLVCNLHHQLNSPPPIWVWECSSLYIWKTSRIISQIALNFFKNKSLKTSSWPYFPQLVLNRIGWCFRFRFRSGWAISINSSFGIRLNFSHAVWWIHKKVFYILHSWLVHRITSSRNSSNYQKRWHLKAVAVIWEQRSSRKSSRNVERWGARTYSQPHFYWKLVKSIWPWWHSSKSSSLWAHSQINVSDVDEVL